jgi:exopolysaccharide biosynthesis polyprenyl glycosylphosphotransferase
MQAAERIKTDLIFEEVPKIREGHYETFKRLFDVCFALILIPILLPFMTLIALLIKLDSKGSVFFAHKRVGKDRRLFNCYKFRTMVENADKIKEKLKHLNEMKGPAFKMKSDPRITRLGRFLRKYSFDEFPQIINILKGDMSFVGPRPPLPEEVEQYKPWHMKRLSIKPGLTCFWQINGRNNIQKFDDWVKMDIKYIETASFVTDLKIILKTLPAVISRRGAY